MHILAMQRCDRIENMSEMILYTLKHKYFEALKYFACGMCHILL